MTDQQNVYLGFYFDIAVKNMAGKTMLRTDYLGAKGPTNIITLTTMPEKANGQATDIDTSKGVNKHSHDQLMQINQISNLTV